MLTKLLPEQVSNFWPIVKYAVEQSLPPIVGEHPDKMNRILSSALSGAVDVWAMYDRGETVKIEAIVLTKFVYDDASGTKSLLIYSLYGYNDVAQERWKQSLDSIVEYAKTKKCHRIIAYSSIPHLIQLGKSLGADTDYTFISFNLEATDV